MVNGQKLLLPQSTESRRAAERSMSWSIQVQNEEKAGLGIPLPAGNVRVYQKDSKGGILFAGEDASITPPKTNS